MEFGLVKCTGLLSLAPQQAKQISHQCPQLFLLAEVFQI